MIEILTLLISGICVNATLLKKLSPRAQIPIVLYGISYLLTSVIGASALAIEPVYDYWSQMTKEYNNIQVLNEIGGEGYFFLLLSPLVLPQTFCLLFYSIFAWFRKYEIRRFSLNLRLSIGVAPIFISFITIAFICIADLHFNNLLLNLVNVTSSADYSEHIFARQRAFSSLSNFYFGMLYVGLPTLLACMVSFYLDRKSYLRLVLIIFSFGLIVYLTLSTIQKAPILILIIFIGSVFWIKNKLTLKKIAIIFILGVSYLTLAYSMVGAGEGGGLSLALFQIIFRMSSSFPYYLSFFPDYHQFTGIFYGLGFFGFGSDGSEAMWIADFMDLNGGLLISGNAPFGFHIMNGYVLGGYWAVVVVEIIFGFYLFISSRWCDSAKSPVSVASAAYFAMWSYYLSQSSFSQVLGRQSWGYVWVLLALTIAFIFGIIAGSIKLVFTSNKEN